MNNREAYNQAIKCRVQFKNMSLPFVTFYQLCLSPISSFLSQPCFLISSLFSYEWPIGPLPPTESVLYRYFGKWNERGSIWYLTLSSLCLWKTSTTLTIESIYLSPFQISLHVLSAQSFTNWTSLNISTVCNSYLIKSLLTHKCQVTIQSANYLF